METGEERRGNSVQGTAVLPLSAQKHHLVQSRLNAAGVALGQLQQRQMEFDFHHRFAYKKNQISPYAAACAVSERTRTRPRIAALCVNIAPLEMCSPPPVISHQRISATLKPAGKEAPQEKNDFHVIIWELRKRKGK